MTEGATLTYIGGPTALVEWRGLRLLTDPTFDPAGSRYEFPDYALQKTQGPAIEPAGVEPVDAVLLSHDHHRDNLDDAGRAVLATAARVLTTIEGAKRLGTPATGLAPWDRAELDAPGGTLVVTATPARHGPAGDDRGPVIGFALAFSDVPDRVLYISGDTVWFEGVREVAERFRVKVAALNVGAARVRIGPHAALTLTAAEAVEAARAMPEAVVVPLHFEAWEHLSESRRDVDQAFTGAGLADRLLWPTPGEGLPLNQLAGLGAA
jgi:L-ascorbate metabolism protein UlaG (beta-lactamase superfamily)